jgi:hypothetical protein
MRPLFPSDGNVCTLDVLGCSWMFLDVLGDPLGLVTFGYDLWDGCGLWCGLWVWPMGVAYGLTYWYHDARHWKAMNPCPIVKFIRDHDRLSRFLSQFYGSSDLLLLTYGASNFLQYFFIFHPKNIQPYKSCRRPTPQAQGSVTAAPTPAVPHKGGPYPY